MANAESPDKPVVLIVDDDPVISLLASQAFLTMGFASETAEHGRAGLEMLEKITPDLIVLDVDMPGLSGFETCEAIRARPETASTPVLIVTGRTDAETIDQAFRSGATDYIQKPLDWQLLAYRVRFMMRANDAFSDLRRALGELSESEKRLAYAQRLAQLGHWEWLPEESQMMWSEQVYRIFDVEQRPGACTYANWLALVHPDERLKVEKALNESLNEARRFSLDYKIITPGGDERVVHHQGEVDTDASGRAERIAGAIQDISARRKAEDEIRYLAYYDSLTGLPNRRLLNEWLGRALESARTRNKQLAILFIDLDRFKRINDTLGHLVGDELLKTVANRLMAHVRMNDYVIRIGAEDVDSATVSRLGGDEFTVILNGVRSQSEAEMATRRILDALNKPMTVGGHELVVTASVGGAVYPKDGDSADTLFRNADTAMYHAKASGRGRFQFFTDDMNAKAMRNLRMEASLLAAIKRRELVLHYQPIKCFESGQITGLEALVRWPTEEFGNVEPSEFIPLAEDTGLINTIGEWVLEESMSQAVIWDERGLPTLDLAVNVSSHQIKDSGFVGMVSDALAGSGLDPKRLEVEVTESALIRDDENASQVLGGLKELGVRVALDDFGTGYSSLSHLVKFPIDRIKIDKSFVSDLREEQEQTDAIIRALVAMAHALGIRATAEGVETEYQEEYLRSLRCDSFQGFRVSPALSVPEVEALLRRR
jgi:diguanylate cyclase (GGDEF)-like protein